MFLPIMHLILIIHTHNHHRPKMVNRGYSLKGDLEDMVLPHCVCRKTILCQINLPVLYTFEWKLTKFYCYQGQRNLYCFSEMEVRIVGCVLG